MKKILVFDFDGTIADTVTLGISLFNEYSEKFGYRKIKPEETENFSARQFLSLAGIKMWKLPFIVFFLRKRLQEKVSAIQVFQGMPELLERFRSDGFELGILSSNSEGTIREVLKSNELENCFSFVRSGVSTFGKKKALSRLRKKLQDSFIYIGDELRDVEACRNTATPVVSVAWGVNSRELLESHNPGFVAGTTDELYEKVLAMMEK